MAWVKLDDQFPEHDSVSDLSDRAFRLHVIALCYCGRRLTDGYLDRRAVSVVSAILTPSRTARWVKELVDAGLWIDNGDGTYEINAFLKYNPTREWVESEREKARLRKQKNGGSGDGSPDGSAELPPELSGDGSASPSPSPAPADSEKPGFSVMGMEPALESLTAAVTNSDKRTLATFRKQVEALDRIDAAYVARLATQCATDGDKGAGWALNALRAEQARRMIAGPTLRAVG